MIKANLLKARDKVKNILVGLRDFSEDFKQELTAVFTVLSLIFFLFYYITLQQRRIDKYDDEKTVRIKEILDRDKEFMIEQQKQTIHAYQIIDSLIKVNERTQ